ncbi:phosphorylcholine transferase LicD [Sporosarcina sp. 6E9]|uniref:LicD family protein n=1 Tax=Sporosarcina sp. 6E9 TaxID=2819235 RepID=UPI001B30A2B3|nr:LicD family protein [Sporosarcina sp. 6E9]
MTVFEMTDENLRLLQLKCLDILLEIDKVCKQNNIDYSLVGGSAIGAVVHKGFIPWDDDIDIVMNRTNFERFKSLSKKELPSNLMLKDFDSDNNFNLLIAKVIDQTTTCVTKSQYGERIVSGVFVDISVFDIVPSNKLLALKQLFYSNLALLFINKRPPENKGKVVKYCSLIAQSILPEKYRYNVIKYSEKKIKAYSNSKKGNLSELVFFNTNRIHFPLDLLDNIIMVKFENYQFPVMKNYHDYLSLRYNRDYTILPDVEERVPHHNIVYLDLNEGFNSFNFKQLDNNI